MNWTLEDVIRFVEACFDRDTILDVLMGYSGHWFESRMVLIVGRAWVQLFATAGFDVPPELGRDRRRADVPEDALAVNEEVATGTAGELGLGRLFGQLELDDALIRTIGVKIGQRVAIVLVGAAHAEDVETGALEAAAAAAGRQLEDVIRMAKADELPPVEARIPPFPSHAEPRGPSAGEVPPQRRTLNLEHEPDADEGVPRISLPGADDSGDELDVPVPAATSFGLPFVKGDVAVPGRAIAEESVSDTDDGAASEANATREGAAYRSEVSLGAEESDGTVIGSPMAEDKFPGDLDLGDAREPLEIDEDPSEDSEAIELNERPNSGVDIVSPRDLGKIKQTQIGGISASSEVMGRPDADDDDDDDGVEPISLTDIGTQIGHPNMIGDAKGTQIGGVRGEESVIRSTFQRVESEAAVRAANEVLAANETGEIAPNPGKDLSKSGPQGAWTNARTTGGAPAAMILKPAKRRGGARKKPNEPGPPSLSGESEAIPRTTRVEAERPQRDTLVEAPRDEEEVDPSGAKTLKQYPDENQAPTVRNPRPPVPQDDEDDAPGALDAHHQPTKVKTSSIDAASVEPAEELGSGSQSDSDAGRTSFGGWGRGEESATRRFDTDGDADDAWFDYFAAHAAKSADDDEEPARRNDVDDEPGIDAALNFSLSEPSDEPHTIPPETLERLLDSGPEMVDMQEQFMILDSRDREKAFEAAERVAELGEKAIEVLDLMFPGRVFLDRYQYGDDLPPVDRHGPVMHALVRLGDLALPVASRHLTDSSNEARFYAVYLLTKLDAEPVLPELFERLFDRDQQIRSIAAEIVLQYQSSPMFDDDVREKIRNELLSGDDVHVTVAADLLARLRDVHAVVTLIDAMDDSATPRVKLAILSALSEITLHHWSSPYEWRQWWRKAKDQSREEWLVEALDSANFDVRQRAHDEVQRIPGLELNYHPDQPSKLRRRAQDALREWLDS